MLGDLEVTTVPKLPECQGMTACRISYDNNDLDGWIMLWGGRTSPTRPQGTIYLWDPQTHRLATPNAIRGTPPTPRWGHSMVALSGNRMAVVGGCNLEEGALGDVYLLHSHESYLCWEQVSTRLASPRFHHVTLVQQDTFFVFGGLQSTTNVVEAFETTNRSSKKAKNQSFTWACRIGETAIEGGTPTTGAKVLATKCATNDGRQSTFSRVGAAGCITNSGSLVVVSGGIDCTMQGDPSPLESSFLSIDKDVVTITNIPIDIACDAGEEVIDFGALVHHSCVSLSEHDFLLLGGGAASFAFGDTFAKYVLIWEVTFKCCFTLPSSCVFLPATFPVFSCF
jgi:hypothetical protein